MDVLHVGLQVGRVAGERFLVRHDLGVRDRAPPVSGVDEAGHREGPGAPLRLCGLGTVVRPRLARPGLAHGMACTPRPEAERVAGTG